MSWFIGYALVALLAASVTSVVGDRFHAGDGVATLLSALLWPVLAIGVVQAALWTLVVDLIRRASAGDAAPAMLRLGLPPR
ncbi:MAG: hypothetical protein KIH64_001080 [Mycobacterium sp.]|nr:hypothetical protein [Mycobacterium sp.]